MAQKQKIEKMLVEQELTVLMELTLRLEDELNNLRLRDEE